MCVNKIVEVLLLLAVVVIIVKVVVCAVNVIDRTIVSNERVE